LNVEPKSFEESMPYIIHKLYRLIHNNINRNFIESGYEISMDQFFVLIYLWKADGRSQRELAGLTGKDKASITRLIDQLVKRKLVKRVSGKTDRRVNHIYLTEKGRHIHNGCKASGIKNREKAVKNISVNDLDITNRTLLKMIENLQH